MKTEDSINLLAQKIAEKADLSYDEIIERAKEKQKELKELVTLEGALHIVASELGIKLLDSPKEYELKIENIIPKMSSVELLCKVIKIYGVREFEREDGSRGKVANILVADDTGAIRAVLWNEHVSMVEGGRIKEGSVIKIRDAYTKENIYGEPEINLGERAKVFVATSSHDFKTIFDKKKKIAELEEGDSNVNVICRVIKIYGVREFEREDGSRGKVANILVADDTGAVRVALWEEDAGLIEKGELIAGSVVMLKNAYVRKRFDAIELNIGKHGKVILNPEDEEAEKIAKIEIGESEIKRSKIAELNENERAEVRAMVIASDKLAIKREEEIRRVVNCLLDDGSARINAVFFDELAEIVDREDIVGREIIVSGRVKRNERRKALEIVASDVEIDVDFRREAENLLNTLNEMLKGEHGT